MASRKVSTHAMDSTGGRFFYVAADKGKRTVLGARDAYNGIALWKNDIGGAYWYYPDLPVSKVRANSKTVPYPIAAVGERVTPDFCRRAGIDSQPTRLRPFDPGQASQMAASKYQLGHPISS